MTHRLKDTLVRSALFGAAFVTTAGVMLAVGGAFHSVSSQPWLPDTPQLRAALDGCPTPAQRHARAACVRELIAATHARHASAPRLAALGRAMQSASAPGRPEAPALR